ncbi:sodium:proton antiporter [Candidatus Sumerlaeota bacterium]|nr:sodium:proton antiporter [Candidatus Sumerlaeota bacterium]
MYRRLTWTFTVCIALLYLLGTAGVPAWSQEHSDSEQPATHAVQDPTGATHAAETEHTPAQQEEHGGHGGFVPHMFWISPFVVLLLCIALLPLIPATAHWWHHNSSKLTIALAMAAVTIIYYFLRDTGFHHAEPGIPTVLKVLNHAVIVDYIPFIVLLFSLYVCSGGINLAGDIRATPRNNATIIGIGAVLANVIGTTGAAMLLIRPLLQINSERKHVKHTVIFFIFLCCNIGGCLLPIGDPPLFLGYLRGVPFTWTLQLLPEWLTMTVMILIIYYVWDMMAYKHETIRDIAHDDAAIKPLKLTGTLNIVWLIGIVLCVAFMVPGKPFFGLFTTPMFMRELCMLTLVAIAWITTSPAIREANKFDFEAIAEVACLFIGIFIAMQVPVEILNIKGAELGLHAPWHFYWATGSLSSFLDNAPTYVVFFETAKTLPFAPEHALTLVDGSHISEPLLIGISIGAVFMGAMTYIGNGPNFMVKSIAESSGIKMPSFFGYMLYSIGILIPPMIIVTLVFLLGH